MTARKPCFHFVTSLFVEDNGKQIFYDYKWMCTRPWNGLNFSPTLPEMKQYILDKKGEKVRQFIENVEQKKHGKIQPSSCCPKPPPSDKFWDRNSSEAIPPQKKPPVIMI